jgi:hypothetical protein
MRYFAEQQDTVVVDPFSPANYCYNEELVLQIQQDQWMKAKLEVFGSTQAGDQSADMDFYRHAFGSVDVTLSSNGDKQGSRSRSQYSTGASRKTEQQKRSKYSSLIYYRIFKNSNDYIRSLLTEYVYVDAGQQREFRAQVCFLLKSDCISPRLHYINPAAMGAMHLTDHSGRFPFTFVREPLQRFISAATEVEYRANLKPTNILPLQHLLGTQARFQEFVRMVLLSGGSRKFFRDLADVEILHIAPMIGTLMLAHKVEGSPLTTYRMEQFDTEWAQLSLDLGTPLLDVLHRNRTQSQRPTHKSSSDPLHTTLAAKSFLSFASIDSFQR